MGLDSVELLIEVEEHFGVVLTSEQVADVETVDDLARLVATTIERESRGPCPSAAAFYALRRATCAVIGPKASRARPSTRLLELFPRRGRRRAWWCLRRERRFVPPLQPNAAAAITLRCLAALLWIGGIAGVAWSLSRWGLGGLLSLPIVPVAGVVVYGAAHTVLATELPAGLPRLGDLEPRTRGRPLPEDRARWHAEVLEGVRERTAQQLGMKLENVLPESRFVDDLGLD